MSRVIPEIVVIFLLTIVNGLFAMSEVALLAARKSRLQQQASQGDARAARALALQQNPNNFLSTVQIGITLVGVISGAFGGATIAEEIAGYLSRSPVLAPHAEAVGISIVVIGVTYLLLILGELVPKRLALHSPEGVAAAVATPTSVVARIGAPLVSVLSASTDTVLALFGLKETSEPAVTEEDVRGLLRQGTQSGVFEPMEQQIVERVFQFSDRRVSTLITPRADVVWLDVNEDYSMWRHLVARSPHSGLLLCDGTLDRVLGIILAKDLLGEAEGTDVRRLLKRPVVISPHTTALQALERLEQAKVHMAVVIDEYGKVEGLLTSTDLLTGLVGELPEGRPDQLHIVPRSNGSWLIDGGLPVQQLKELLKLHELPREETGAFQTIAGFVIDNLRKIPSEGDHFVCRDYRFEIVDMDGRRIDKVLVAPVRRSDTLDGKAA
jgi:putative hemolysin